MNVNESIGREESPSGGAFDPTHGSVVAATQGENGPRADGALETVRRGYPFMPRHGLALSSLFLGFAAFPALPAPAPDAGVELKPILILRHFAEVTCARFRPDGRRILTASLDNGTRLWDASSGKLLTDLSEHDGGVLHADFSPDGQKFLTASADDTARVWSSSTGDWLTGPLLHPADVLQARFSPDGGTLVTLCQDRTVRLWKAASGESVGAPMAHPKAVTKLAFTPDGRTLLTVAGDGVVYRWTLATGVSAGEPMPLGDDLGPIEFSPDGQSILASERHGRTKLWSLTQRLVSQELHGATNVALARFSPDGKRVFATDNSTYSSLWEIRDLRMLSLDRPDPAALTFVEFSQDDRWLATGDRAGTLRLHSTRSNQASKAGRQHEKAIAWIEFSPAGNKVVTASLDGTAVVWQIVPP